MSFLGGHVGDDGGGSIRGANPLAAFPRRVWRRWTLRRLPDERGWKHAKRNATAPAHPPTNEHCKNAQQTTAVAPQVDLRVCQPVLSDKVRDWLSLFVGRSSPRHQLDICAVVGDFLNETKNKPPSTTLSRTRLLVALITRRLWLLLATNESTTSSFHHSFWRKAALPVVSNPDPQPFLPLWRERNKSNGAPVDQQHLGH